MSIYSEGNILGIKIKLRNGWAYARDGWALVLALHGIL